MDEIKSISENWKTLLEKSYELRGEKLPKQEEMLKEVKTKLSETLTNLKKLKEYFPSLKEAKETTKFCTSYVDWTYSTSFIETALHDWDEITDTEKTSKYYLQGVSISDRFKSKKERLLNDFFNSFTEELSKCDNLKEVEDRVRIYKVETKEFKEGLDKFFSELLQPIANSKQVIENLTKDIDDLKQRAKKEYIKLYWPTLQSKPLYLKDKKGEKVGYVKILNEDKSGLGYTVEDIESSKRTYHVKLQNLEYDYRDFNNFEDELYKKYIKN